MKLDLINLKKLKQLLHNSTMGACYSGRLSREVDSERAIEAQAYAANNVFSSKRCRVNNCKESHNKHYCRVCNNTDSTHFARYCPTSVKTNTFSSSKSVYKQNPQFDRSRPNSANASNYESSKSRIGQKCKVNNCQTSHNKHFCRECKNEDSLHFSRECPNLSVKQRSKIACSQEYLKQLDGYYKDAFILLQKIQQIQSNIQIKKKNAFSCKVIGCPDNHKQHFCAVCQNTDSPHFASQCPDGIIAYHGTAQIYKQAIKKGGFKPSQTGRIGKGVYFSDDFDIVWQIAKNRAKKLNSQPIVFQVMIPRDDIITQKQQHPTWNGVTQGPFNELKVNKQKQIKIIKIFDKSNFQQ